MPVTTTTRPAATTAATTPAQAAALSRLSFAELAKARAEPLLAEIVKDMAALTPTMMPHDPESKALRKKVARFRDVLDVFAHAWGGTQERAWKRARDRVDDGYEALGGFKDLFDSQEIWLKGSDPNKPNEGVAPADVKYDANILKRRKDAVLEWKRGFLDAGTMGELKNLIANPAATPQDVAERNLTRFFWGSVSVRPNAQLTGMENTKALGSALIEEARESLTALMTTASIRGEAAEEAFHDVRKRLRSLVNLTGSFPEIVDNAAKAEPLLKTVATFVSRFGDVEDRLVAMHIAMEERDVQALPGKQKIVDDSWVELRAEIMKAKLGDALKSLGALV